MVNREDLNEVGATAVDDPIWRTLDLPDVGIAAFWHHAADVGERQDSGCGLEKFLYDLTGIGRRVALDELPYCFKVLRCLECTSEGALQSQAGTNLFVTERLPRVRLSDPTLDLGEHVKALHGLLNRRFRRQLLDDFANQLLGGRLGHRISGRAE